MSEDFEEIINPKTEEKDSIEAEIVEPKLLPAKIEESKEERKKGKLSIKYRTVAEYAARGYPVEIISKMSGVKVTTVYALLEKNELVWEEINRILAGIFSEGDRILANLYIKALYKLDDQLSSTNPEIYGKAVEKIVKMYGDRAGSKSGEKPSILQFFGSVGGRPEIGQGPLIEGGIDQLILKKRKERGLENSDEPTVSKNGYDDLEGEDE